MLVELSSETLTEPLKLWD